MLRLRPHPPSLTGREPFYWLCTWLMSGRIRPASGTWGSLAALPFCWAIKSLGGVPLILVFAVVMFVLGMWSIKLYAKHTHHLDPSEIVIDEVVGMAVAWIFIPAENVLLALTGFVFFRLFDSIKRGPVGWCDKKIKGAMGVMVDDVVAGLLAGLSVLILIKLF